LIKLYLVWLWLNLEYRVTKDGGSIAYTKIIHENLTREIERSDRSHHLSDNLLLLQDWWSVWPWTWPCALPSHLRASSTNWWLQRGTDPGRKLLGVHFVNQTNFSFSMGCHAQLKRLVCLPWLAPTTGFSLYCTNIQVTIWVRVGSNIATNTDRSNGSLARSWPTRFLILKWFQGCWSEL
jgi:hypothetical protein